MTTTTPPPFRTLAARFAGICRRCRGPIAVGQTIRYGGKGRCYHLAADCPQGTGYTDDPPYAHLGNAGDPELSEPTAATAPTPTFPPLPILPPRAGETAEAYWLRTLHHVATAARAAGGELAALLDRPAQLADLDQTAPEAVEAPAGEANAAPADLGPVAPPAPALRPLAPPRAARRPRATPPPVALPHIRLASQAAPLAAEELL